MGVWMAGRRSGNWWKSLNERKWTMKKMNELLQKELLNRIYDTALKIIHEGAGDWTLEEGLNIPIWGVRALAAANDLSRDGEDTMGGEIIAALINETYNAPEKIKICIYSSALEIVKRSNMQKGVFWDGSFDE